MCQDGVSISLHPQVPLCRMYNAFKMYIFVVKQEKFWKYELSHYFLYFDCYYTNVFLSASTVLLLWPIVSNKGSVNIRTPCSYFPLLLYGFCVLTVPISNVLHIILNSSGLLKFIHACTTFSILYFLTYLGIVIWNSIPADWSAGLWSNQFWCKWGRRGLSYSFFA